MPLLKFRQILVTLCTKERREKLSSGILEAHLPSTLAIGTGEIIDSDSSPNSPRRQFDIVIYKRSLPKLDFGGGVSGFLVESVIATIEVKSTLDKAGMEQAITAAYQAKRLKKMNSGPSVVVISLLPFSTSLSPMMVLSRWIRFLVGSLI